MTAQGITGLYVALLALSYPGVLLYLRWRLRGVAASSAAREAAWEELAQGEQHLHCGGLADHEPHAWTIEKKCPGTTLKGEQG